MSKHLIGLITGLILAAVASETPAHERAYHPHQKGNTSNANKAIYELTHPWPFRDRHAYSVGRMSAASMSSDATQSGELKSDAALREDFTNQLFDTGKISTSRVHFDFDKDQVKPESEPVLNTVGNLLSEWPELEIEISGYADHTGPELYNQDLSERRARSVLTYLTRHFSRLDPNHLSTVGFGETRPAASNETRSGRAQNRRVQFRVLNEGTLKRIDRTRD